MRRLRFARGSLVACLAVVMVAAGCVGVGGPVPGAPAHHRERGFANTNPAFTRPGFWTLRSFQARRLWAAIVGGPPTVQFERAPNDGAVLRRNAGDPTVTWVGHSTLLVQLDGVNVLTDPQWSSRASPVSWAGPARVTPPGLAFEALPPIHAVVISHDHYDHLDVATVRRLAAEHKPKFFVPLGIKAWLHGLGITDVEELDWWDSRRFRDLTLTCVPAQHFAARTPFDTNRRLWSGWTIAGRARRLFFAGDTGYFDAFREIASRLGPFDLAAIPIGAYVPPAIMQFTHVTPEQALQIFADVRAERLLAVHWGTFDLAEEPIDEPPQRLLAAAARLGLASDRIWVFKHGETRAW
ncbi:MAG TPA: MBL fold metallo-hydrolase [Methylomirabilota bacterium]|jgi:L-ascorbate metabolism protein UlaG (beta-lactamase superfamily)